MGRSIMTPLSVVFGEVGSKSWDYRDWISGSSQEWAGMEREIVRNVPLSVASRDVVRLCRI